MSHHGNDPCSPQYVPETLLERIEDVSNELKLMQNLVSFISERVVEPQSQHHNNFFTHVLAMSGHTSTFLWLNLPDLAPEEINVMLSDLLRIFNINRCELVTFKFQ
ncbi:hypothetical protein BC332_10798 [Capsicum chinense]|nr:hypothetical protein BC332_10798 [Capsicum chinense]